MKESKVVRGVIATVAVIAFSVPAIASADELKGRTEKVSYSDLNVDKEAGAHALYRRLQLASKRVCGVESARQQRCYKDALDDAVAKINNATLTEIHEG